MSCHHEIMYPFFVCLYGETMGSFWNGLHHIWLGNLVRKGVIKWEIKAYDQRRLECEVKLLFPHEPLK